MALEVDAIILNWNSFDLIRDCIASLKASTYTLNKIVVVDNGSSDNSVRLLDAAFLEDSQLVILKSKTNLGFSGGNNIGIEYSIGHGADCVFLINNDTIVGETCIQSLIGALEDDDQAGLAGPLIFYHSYPEKVWQGGGRFSWLKGGVIVPLKGKDLKLVPKLNVRVTFLTGCALLIHKNVFTEIGLLDPSFFFYMEDVDFSLRAVRARFRPVFVPSARVWHKIDDIAKDRTSPFVLYHIAKSSILMFRKRFSFPYAAYGITLQFVAFTPFRIFQALKGGAGIESIIGWFRGLVHGLMVDIKKNEEQTRTK